MGGWSSESFVQQEHLKAGVEMLPCSGRLIEFEGCTSLSVCSEVASLVFNRCLGCLK